MVHSAASDAPPDIVRSLNELLWREWNNLIEAQVPARMIPGGLAAQKSEFRALFVSNGGFIGKSHNLSAQLICLIPLKRRDGARTLM